MPALTAQANAKVNLGLRIIGRQPDGYHLLHTLFAEIGYGDTITLTDAAPGQISLEVSGPQAAKVPKDESNLCLAAAHLLRQETGHAGGVHIALDKQVPPGSGLGGGSSDGAAVIKGLNELWGTGVSIDNMELLAAELGADVPFFIRGKAQLGEGVGDRLSPVTLAENPAVVLVMPPLQIDTAWAYGLFAERTEFPESHDFGEIAEASAIRWDRLQNDFEEVVFPHHPQLGKIKVALLSAGAVYAGLSGSGSAVIGLFDSPPDNLSSTDFGEAEIIKTQLIR
ncbi:MAG: 4-(cytidine 5'-diphospho)-2-C-methyl-D-erythritol kinase [Candidatus Marinimicrobia bacterium]|nr:4-(cytidine 5'-diphospho)-2-C-methyl-D-erythritol kinase [Candidatus Neomarinimicrobiota bacterium]